MFFSRRLSRLVCPFAEISRRWAVHELGLSSKLLFIIILVSMIGVLTSSLFILSLHRQQLEEAALLSATQQSQVIEIGLQHAMLDHNRDMLDQIIRSMVDDGTVDNIRILDSKGMVQVSSISGQVGQRFDYSQPTCQFCHPNTARPSNSSTIIDVRPNHRALLNMNMIYNQPKCYGCHDAQHKVLGMTMIEMSLNHLNSELTESFWRIVFSSLVTLGLLIGLMTFALRRLVIHPVEELTKGMTAIHRGDLDYELPLMSSADELGELAESFDAMRKQLKSSRTENIELQKQTQSLAILQERDRLAREMHDNLAQTLGYINLRAAIADNQLVANQSLEARNSLAELKKAAKEAYTDVRESIFNLRSPNPSGDGLLSLLTNCISQYRAQYGIGVRLAVEDERLAEFPVEIQVQVHRIVQEALTNVRKHSKASQAWVRFEQVDHSVRIQVEDNGKGFDPAALTGNGSAQFGLQIMRERAESVGGELEIDSKPGAGTRVRLYVPIFPLIEDPHEEASYPTR